MEQGNETVDLEKLKEAAMSPENLNLASKIINDLKADLVKAFSRLATSYNTTEDKIQIGFRFHDLPDNTGELYYSLMVNWKPERELSFNRDFLGQTGTEAMFPDESGKENFVKAYLLGMPMLHLPGALQQIAIKHQIVKWSHISAFFYKFKADSPIKLAVYITNGNKSEKVETISIFSEESGTESVVNEKTE